MRVTRMGVREGHGGAQETQPRNEYGSSDRLREQSSLFYNAQSRIRSAYSLTLMLEDPFHTKSHQEWVAIAARNDIPMGPALRLDEIAEDPYLAARGMLVQEDHPPFGALHRIGSPIRASGKCFLHAVRSSA